MDWSITAIGFGSALLGAMLGFAGSLYHSSQEQSKREKGVVRALLGELFENTSLAIMATTGHESLKSFSTSVWTDAKLQIAQLTSSALFGTLLGTYSTRWVAETALEQLKAGDRDAVKTMELWYESAQTAHNMLLAEFEGSTTEGWNEMPDFEAGLRELRQTRQEA